MGLVLLDRLQKSSVDCGLCAICLHDGWQRCCLAHLLLGKSYCNGCTFGNTYGLHTKAASCCFYFLYFRTNRGFGIRCLRCTYGPRKQYGQSQDEGQRPGPPLLLILFILLLLVIQLPLPSKSQGSSSQVVQTCPSPYRGPDVIHSLPVYMPPEQHNESLPVCGTDEAYRDHSRFFAY